MQNKKKIDISDKAFNVLSDFGKKVLINSIKNMTFKNLKLLYKSTYEKYLFLTSIPITIYFLTYPIDKIINLPSWWYLVAPVNYFFYKAIYQVLRQCHIKNKYKNYGTIFDEKSYVIDVKIDKQNDDIKSLYYIFAKEFKKIKFSINNIIQIVKNEKRDSIIVVLKGIISEISMLKISFKRDKSKDKTTFIIYSFISTYEVWRQCKKVEKALKTTIIDISHCGKKTYLIETSNKVWKKYLRDLETDKEKILYAFKRSGYHLTSISTKSNKYQEVISFDSDIEPKDMYKSIDYFKHVTKIDFMIDSSEYKDYEIVIQKDVGVVDFFELFKNAHLDDNNNMMLGYDRKGKEIVISLFDLYHSIVAGTTGFGKSNLAHVVISSLLKSPLDIVAVLLDPKVNELKRYRDIENVYFSDDKNKILDILEFLVNEMVKRNKLIKEDKFVHDIDTWNKKYPDKKMPYIVVYVEEIADLILSSNGNSKKLFENCITRLTQLGRSTGFRLFLSTQSPKREIITTIIKSCCATRFGFGVTNVSESMVVLDNNNCKGLKKGEMILQMNGTETKIKVPLLKSIDIENIINYLENICKYAKKPMAKKFVSFMSNQLINSNSSMSETMSCDIQKNKKEINNSDELLELYKIISPDKNETILSIDKTLLYVKTGRTKLQELRKELVDKKHFINKNKKLYWKLEEN